MSLAGAKHGKDFADICQDILSERCSNEFNNAELETNRAGAAFPLDD